MFALIFFLPRSQHPFHQAHLPCLRVHQAIPVFPTRAYGMPKANLCYRMAQTNSCVMQSMALVFTQAHDVQLQQKLKHLVIRVYLGVARTKTSNAKRRQ